MASNLRNTLVYRGLTWLAVFFRNSPFGKALGQSAWLGSMLYYMNGRQCKFGAKRRIFERVGRARRPGVAPSVVKSSGRGFAAYLFCGREELIPRNRFTTLYYLKISSNKYVRRLTHGTLYLVQVRGTLYMVPRTSYLVPCT